MTSSRTHAAAAQLVSTVEAFGLPLPRLTSVRPNDFDVLLASPDAVREWAEFLTVRNGATAAVSEVIGVTKVKATWLGVEFEAFYFPTQSEAVPREGGPKPGDRCRLLGDYRVEHWDCDEHRDGVVTDVRTGLPS